MKIVLAGATGYIGTRLTSLALKKGHEIVIASRQRPLSSALAWIFFDLSSLNLIVIPVGTDVVIHLAANTTQSQDLNADLEVAAAQNLMKVAHEAGAKFIFVSSQTAQVDAATAYGRIKWRIEQAVLSSGGWVVRPGQVYGGALRGLFGTLVKTVENIPVLPMFIPAPQIQPIHVDDLSEGLLRIAERGDVPSAVYGLAAPQPVSFIKFLVEIARSRLRLKRFGVPVPVIFINALGQSLRTRFGLERLRSLFDLPVMATASDLTLLGLTLRPLRSGMHPSGSDRRRRVLQEGLALLTYISKATPSSVVLRRYARVIEEMRGGAALGLPPLLMNLPATLSMLDASLWADKTESADYAWRLDAATLLAEATPAGAERFLGIGSELERTSGVLFTVIEMTSAVVGEIIWRILRAFLSPMVHKILARARGAA